MRVVKYEAANEGAFCFQPIERGMKVCFIIYRYCI